MFRRVVWNLTILFVILSKCHGIRYRNYALLHGTPRDQRELKFYNDMPKLYNVTFWRRPGKVYNSVEFTINPFSYAELMIDTFNTKMRFRTIMEDVQSAFDKQTIMRYTRRQIHTFNWEHYYDLDSIYGWLKDLSSSYPQEVQLLPIGQSVENRVIYAVKLELNKQKKCKRKHKPKVMLEGGCHAREWISPAVVTYIINALLNADTSNSEQLKHLAPLYDWFFVPVMNPDGFVYSHTQDRLWKKNRRDGHGVDLNRNFGILFGKQDAKIDKNDEEYCGKDPFSEPETAALAAFARDISVGLEYYLSFHSYGQHIILPYSFSKSHEDNYNKTKVLADLVVQKLIRKYHVQYDVGTTYDTLGYLASGVSADWVKRALNVTHVATITLPDAGALGYALPPDQILPICEATLDGLLEFFEQPPDDSFDPEEEEEFSSVTQERARAGVLLFCNAIIYICNGFK